MDRDFSDRAVGYGGAPPGRAVDSRFARCVASAVSHPHRQGPYRHMDTPDQSEPEPAQPLAPGLARADG